MPRALWSGSISFGLVNIPIQIFTAVEQKEVHFHLLHAKDGGRIRQQRVCERDDEVVEWKEIAKGYAVSRTKWVMLTQEELDAIDPRASRTLDIDAFVELEEIDPVYFEHTYYVSPMGGAAKAYSLLHKVMEQARKVALAKFVMRGREHLCCLRPLDGILAISTMQYPDEIRPTSMVKVPKGAPDRRELAAAEQLVDALTTTFDPKRYHDEYRAKVQALIKRKAKGETIEPAEAEPEPAPVTDLMAALKASLEEGRKGPRAATRARPARKGKSRRAA